MLLTAYNEDQSTGSWLRLMLLLHSALVVSSKGGVGSFLFADVEPEDLHLSFSVTLKRSG